MNLRIETSRLELIAADLALVRADLHHREELARRLDARLEDWPPPLYEVSSMQWAINRLTEDPARVGWVFLVLLAASPQPRSAELTSKPNPYLPFPPALGYNQVLCQMLM